MNDTTPLFTPLAIAFARTPFKDAAAIPKGPGAKHEADGTLEFLPGLEAGLTDIEGFSHLFVLWVF
ncbi:MAG: tRNA (N6-threonylcarbamoyladenosine(37)-N6)-methyltransferase TrmO, partial [Acidobacteriota bacterium]